jgi:hypothetical protein
MSNSPRHSRPKDGVASLAYARITPASLMQTRFIGPGKSQARGAAFISFSLQRGRGAPVRRNVLVWHL